MKQILSVFFIVLISTLATAQVVDEQQAYKVLASKLYNEALKADSAGNTSNALKSLEQAIYLDPEFALAYQKSGELKFKTSDREGALADLNKAIAINPSKEAYLLRAQNFINAGDYDAAQADMAKAKSISGDNTLDAKNDEIINKLIEEIYSQGLNDLNENKTDDALDKFNEIISMNPGFANAYLQKGIIYFKESDFTSSINNFQRANELNPSTLAELYIIRSEIKLGKSEEAIHTIQAIDKSGLDEESFKTYNQITGELADSFYKKGLELEKQNKFPEALAQFKLVSQLKPQFADAYSHQGFIFLQQKNYAPAIVALNKSIELQPTKQAYLNLGTAKTETGDLDGAFEALAKAKQMTNNGNPDETLLPSAMVSNIQKSATNTPATDPIAENTQENKAIADEDSQPQQNIIEEELKEEVITPENNTIVEQPVKEVLKESATATQTEPETPDYFSIIDQADEFYKNEMFDAASEYYKQASEIDPLKQYPKTRIREIENIKLKTIQESNKPETGQTVKPEDITEVEQPEKIVPAEKDIDELPGKDADKMEGSDESISLYNEGLALYYESDLEGALAKFKEAINLDPSLVDAYYNSGFIKLNQADFEEAIADFDIVLSIAPNDKVYFYKGRAYLGLNELENAAIQFSMAIELNPQFFYAYNNRGNILFQLGKYEAAVEDFTNALNINPDYVFAYNNRGNAYFKLNNFDAAMADYNIAINLRPDYGFAYLNRGITHELMGNMDDACADWKKAADMGIQVAKIYYQEQCEKE